MTGTSGGEKNSQPGTEFMGVCVHSKAGSHESRGFHIQGPREQEKRCPGSHAPPELAGSRGSWVLAPRCSEHLLCTQPALLCCPDERTDERTDKFTPSRQQNCLSGCSPGVTRAPRDFQGVPARQPQGTHSPPAAAHAHADICSERTLRRACSPALRPAPWPSHVQNEGCVALHLTRHTARAEPPAQTPGRV